MGQGRAGDADSDGNDLRRCLRRVLVVVGVAALPAALRVAGEALLIGFAAVLVAILLAAAPISRRTGLGRRWALLARNMRRVVLPRADSREVAEPPIPLPKTPRNWRLQGSSVKSMACA